MGRSIDIAGFDAKFAGDGDPWRTLTDRDEATKRDAILHALGPGPLGRVLEWGAGNGSNSRAIAPRARRLDATEATGAGTALVGAALASCPRARALRLAAPAPPPRPAYDGIVIAELLYYLSPRAMAALARDTARRLRPGGTLVLAHHRITFYDFAQHAEAIHARFLRDTGLAWRGRTVKRTGRWAVLALSPTGRPSHIAPAPHDRA